MIMRYAFNIGFIASLCVLGQIDLAKAQWEAKRTVGVYESNPFDQSYSYGEPAAPAAPRSDLAEAAGAIATIFGAVAGQKAAKEERKRQRELEARYSAPTNVQNVTVDNWGVYTPPPVATPTCEAGDTPQVINNQPYCIRTMTCKTQEKLSSSNNVASCMKIYEGGAEDLASTLSCSGELRIKDKMASCIMSPPSVK